MQESTKGRRSTAPAKRRGERNQSSASPVSSEIQVPKRRARGQRFEKALVQPPLRGSQTPKLECSPLGRIHISGAQALEDVGSRTFLHFVQAVFSVDAMQGLIRHGGSEPSVDLRFNSHQIPLNQILIQIAEALEQASLPEETKGLKPEGATLWVAAPGTATDRHGTLHYHRYGTSVTGFQLLSERPGVLQLGHPALYRKRSLTDALERALMNLPGVIWFETNSRRCRVKIEFDPRRLGRNQLFKILDRALEHAEHQVELDRLDHDLAICTGSIGVAALAQFSLPPLIPVAAGIFAYTSIPSLRNAYRALRERKTVGVDFLDSVVVVGCLATLQVFPGAILAWCLSFGRTLVQKTEDRSKKMLLSAFGKQPQVVWLLRDGVEIEVPLEHLVAGDRVIVHTGDMVPVDGHIVDGLAMVDQQMLTGESQPAEKGVGEKVFASTILVGGRILVEVDRAGTETASAKISQILNDTAGYKLASQHSGERLADTAVIPTLMAGALAYTTFGPHAAVAAMNSDLGTGIRMAAPLAMLSTLNLCAQKGILVKDGRALELMNSVDTVLFDKTGTLTRERPEVGTIHALSPYSEAEVLRFAAAAEQKFHHPIAAAILQKAEELGITLPPPDETQYQLGFGIEVSIEGRIIHVGSRRFMDLEQIEIPGHLEPLFEAAHQEGLSLVWVAIERSLAGILELRASVRPEVRELVQGLRARGIRHIAIISGDHEAPTRKLAESLGMDRYFAEVLPQDKAAHVEALQKEGRTVLFVGDGINDSIALKKANVSISLCGATSIATDTAHIVFMEQGLSKLCELMDLARSMQKNVRNSWIMIVVPNVVCVAGVFFLGFGIATSVVTNNVSALLALGNGLLPLFKVARIESERRLRMEQELSVQAAETLIPD